jgi:hypothetical protein
VLVLRAALTGGQTKPVWFFHGLRDRGVPFVSMPQLFEVFEKTPSKLNGSAQRFFLSALAVSTYHPVRAVSVCADRVVLFNAGFMIRYQRTGVSLNPLAPNTKQSSYVIDTDALEKLRAIASKVPGIQIGGYVQEYDIDASALQLLFRLFNTERNVFKYGACVHAPALLPVRCAVVRCLILPSSVAVHRAQGSRGAENQVLGILW